MNILLCSVGRRGELLKNFQQSMAGVGKIIATDCSEYAPALYFADKHYIVPRISDPNYIDIILNICQQEEINAITTFIDPEIELLSRNRHLFRKINVEVLAPYEKTSEICFDKFKMYRYLKANNIDTVSTWGDFTTFKEAYESGKVTFPVFVKPRTGSGSVGAMKVESIDLLEKVMIEDSTLIVQEFMSGNDLDADVYVDTISHEAVSIFSKKKLETRIGGASKTISFKDEKLFDFVQRIVKIFEFNGPIDMDFFYQNGKYYLSEINPRFGGAYLHAYGSGVDFIKLIEKNLQGESNIPDIGNYKDDVVMMMYDSVVIL